jgi:lipopolysaccharide export system permease protein
MIAGTLSRYFGLRFFNAVIAVFAGAMSLVAMIDFLEMLRRTGDMKDVSALLVA